MVIAATLIKELVVTPPEPIAFGEDFLEAPALERIGERLIEQNPAFNFLSEASITYLWKAKGGNTKGKATLGKCQKPSGLLRFFSSMDFVIWVAADHVRTLQQRLDFEAKQVEAIVFHELCHCNLDEDELTGIRAWTVVGHDVETFAAEIREYGLWKDDLREMGLVVRQMRFEEAR